MLRRNQENPNFTAKKEIWDHFLPSEMEAIGAYCKAFDGIYPRRKQKVDAKEGTVTYTEEPLPKYFQNLKQAPRPWTCYERFIRAVTAFVRKMEDNPASAARFRIADLEADGTIVSGDTWLDPKETAKSKKIFYEIVGKNGTQWGDGAALDSYAKGFGGDVCRKFGFKECEPPPFQEFMGEISTMLDDISGMKEEENKNSMVPQESIPDQSKEVVTTRGRGRPKKEPVAS